MVLANLPSTLKQQIEFNLLNNNFPLAKQLYDAWRKNAPIAQKEAA